jgi:hypothetical protein
MVPAQLLQLEASEAVSTEGLGQSHLVRCFLRWDSHEFVNDLFQLRAEVDAAIRSAAHAHPADTDLAGYPIGYCKQIRDVGLSRLLAPEAADVSRPALSAVAAFREAGGLVKGVWGVQKGIYFQNAIQIGHLWCDLSNDTVDPRRPAVEVCPLSDARFEELASFEQFAEVAACYWEEEAYPNHLFSAIAAVLPVILVSRDGRRLQRPSCLAICGLTIRSRRHFWEAVNLRLEGFPSCCVSTLFGPVAIAPGGLLRSRRGAVTSSRLSALRMPAA